MLRNTISQSGIGLAKDKRFSRGQSTPPHRAVRSRLRIWALESACGVTRRPGLPATSWQGFLQHFRTASSSRLHASTPGTPASSGSSPSAVPPRKPQFNPLLALLRLFGGIASLGWLVFGMAIFFGFVKQLFFPASAINVAPPMLPQVSIVVSPPASRAPSLPPRVDTQPPVPVPSQVSSPAQAGRAAVIARTVLLGPFVAVMAVIRAAWTLTGFPVKAVEAVWSPPTVAAAQQVPSTAAAAAASTAAAAAASQPAAPVVPPIATPDLLTPVTSVLDHATKAIQSVHPGDIYKGMAAVIAAAGKPMRVACEALLTCSLMAAFYACCIAALSIPLWAAGKLLRRSCRPRGTRVIFETGSDSGLKEVEEYWRNWKGETVRKRTRTLQGKVIESTTEVLKEEDIKEAAEAAQASAATTSSTATAVAESEPVAAGPSCDITIFKKARAPTASAPESSAPAANTTTGDQSPTSGRAAVDQPKKGGTQSGEDKAGGASSEPLPPGARMVSDVLVDINSVVSIPLPKGGRGRLELVQYEDGTEDSSSDAKGGDSKGEQQEGSLPTAPAAGGDKKEAREISQKAREIAARRLVEYEGKQVDVGTYKQKRGGTTQDKGLSSDVYLGVLRNILASEAGSKTTDGAALPAAAPGVKGKAPVTSATDKPPTPSSPATKEQAPPAAQASPTPAAEAKDKGSAPPTADSKPPAAASGAPSIEDTLEYSPALPWSTSAPTLSPADLQEIQQRRAAVVQRLRERAKGFISKEEAGSAPGVSSSAGSTSDSSTKTPPSASSTSSFVATPPAAGTTKGSILGLAETAKLLQGKEAAGADMQQAKDSTPPASKGSAAEPDPVTTSSKDKPEGSVSKPVPQAAGTQKTAQEGVEKPATSVASAMEQYAQEAAAGSLFAELARLKQKHMGERERDRFSRAEARAKAVFSKAPVEEAAAKAREAAAQAGAPPASGTASAPPPASAAPTAKPNEPSSAPVKPAEVPSKGAATAAAAGDAATKSGSVLGSASAAAADALANKAAEPTTAKASLQENEAPAVKADQAPASPPRSEFPPARARTGLHHPAMLPPAVRESLGFPATKASEYPAVLSQEDAAKPTGAAGHAPAKATTPVDPTPGKTAAAGTAVQGKMAAVTESKSGSVTKPAAGAGTDGSAPAAPPQQPAAAKSDASATSKPPAAAASAPQIVDWSSRAYINRHKEAQADDKPAAPAAAATSAPKAPAAATEPVTPAKKDAEVEKPASAPAAASTTTTTTTDKVASAAAPVAKGAVIAQNQAQAQAPPATKTSPSPADLDDELPEQAFYLKEGIDAALRKAASLETKEKEDVSKPVRVKVEVVQHNNKQGGSEGTSGAAPGASPASADAARPVRVRVQVVQDKPAQAPPPTTTTTAAAVTVTAGVTPSAPPATAPASTAAAPAQAPSKDSPPVESSPLFGESFWEDSDDDDIFTDDEYLEDPSLFTDSDAEELLTDSSATAGPAPTASTATSSPASASATTPPATQSAPTSAAAPSKPAGAVRVVVTPGPSAPSPAAAASHAGAVRVVVVPAAAATKVAEPVKAAPVAPAKDAEPVKASEPGKPAAKAAEPVKAPEPAASKPSDTTAATTTAAPSPLTPSAAAGLAALMGSASARSMDIITPATKAPSPAGIRVVIVPAKAAAPPAVASPPKTVPTAASAPAATTSAAAAPPAVPSPAPSSPATAPAPAVKEGPVVAKDSKGAAGTPGAGTPLPRLEIEGKLVDKSTGVDKTSQKAAVTGTPADTKASDAAKRAETTETAVANSKPGTSKGSGTGSDDEGNVLIIRTRNGSSGQKEADLVRQWAQSTTRYLHSTVVLNNAVLNTTRASPGPQATPAVPTGSPATNGKGGMTTTSAASAPATTNSTTASAGTSANGTSSASGSQDVGASTSAPVSHPLTRKYTRRTRGGSPATNGVGSADAE